MVELRELLTGASTSVPLDIAALQIGMIDDPNADIESALLLLDSHAAEFGERVTRRTSGQEFVTAIQRVSV